MATCATSIDLRSVEVSDKQVVFYLHGALSAGQSRQVSQEAWIKWNCDSPPTFSPSMKSGVVGRDGRSVAVGPHNRRSHVQMWQRPRVSRAGCTNAQQSGQTYRITGYSHGDRPQMAIAGVHHTCHIAAGQMYEEHHYTTISDSQFAGSHRGRKRLSREATRCTVLALEWPELVQIGRYKVRWALNAANKRNLTSFC